MYKYLSLDLNKLIAGVTTTKGIAQQRYGSYARQAVESTYGGNYITVRPRYAEPKKLKVYLTRIYWNEEENYLCFEEREREDSEFAQTGQVYIPDGSRIFLMTIRAGWVRTVQVSKPVGNSAILRGLITSQFDGGGGNFTPIVAPIVYIKMKPEQNGQLGELAEDGPDYKAYVEHIRNTVVERYVRIALPVATGGSSG